MGEIWIDKGGVFVRGGRRGGGGEEIGARDLMSTNRWATKRDKEKWLKVY